METRFSSDKLECRSNDDKNLISGYAIVFNKESVDLGGFKEVISERALDNVDLDDVYFYAHHKSESVLGNTKSGTLQLRVTDVGLYFTATLPETTLGKDTYELVKRGDLKSLSFGFIAQEDIWDTRSNPQIRTVTQIKKLDEISIVSRPAYEDTMVSTRAKEVIKICRDCNNINNINKHLEEAKQILKDVK